MGTIPDSSLHNLVMDAVARAVVAEERLELPLTVFAVSAEGHFLVAHLIDGSPRSKTLAFHPPPPVSWTLPVTVILVDSEGRTYVDQKPKEALEEFATN